MGKLRQLKAKILDTHFFRPRWYSVFINPYFINRRSLYQAIRKFSSGTKDTASVLDVGCGLKPYRNLFTTDNYTGIDISGGGHDDALKTVDTFFDGSTIPYPDESYDTLLCTQVLEHADDPGILVQECARVLTSNGKALFSMPFIYPEHEVPYDFRRFTRFEHERLLRKHGFTTITILKTTGFFGTFGQLFVIFIFEGIPFRAPLLKALLTVFIFAPIQIVSLFLDMLTRKSGPTMDYVIIAKK